MCIVALLPCCLVAFLPVPCKKDRAAFAWRGGECGAVVVRVWERVVPDATRRELGRLFTCRATATSSLREHLDHAVKSSKASRRVVFLFEVAIAKLPRRTP